MIGGVLPQSIRPLARVMATRLISPTQRREAAKLSRVRPVQLNVGCGSLPLPGWINLDLALQEEFYGFGHKAVYDHETVALFLHDRLHDRPSGHSVRAGSIRVRTANGARATRSTRRRASSPTAQVVRSLLVARTAAASGSAS